MTSGVFYLTVLNVTFYINSTSEGLGPSNPCGLKRSSTTTSTVEITTDDCHYTCT